MAKILGIDLGTTNSCMAVMEGGQGTVLENSEGARTTPSIVAFTKSGERLVGQAAKRQAVTNPKNTVFSSKRLIGRKYSELTEEDKKVPYEIVEAPNGDAYIRVDVGGEKKTFSPQEIASMVLAKLKADAESKLGETITEAVITVPAYFNDAQRNATKAAGEIAGLKVRRIINEPTAAALAYGLDKKSNENIAVYDLGGGTFDITLFDFSVDEEGKALIDVLEGGSKGDDRLGGVDWDARMYDYMCEKYTFENGISQDDMEAELQFKIKAQVEQAKKDLSTLQKKSYTISYDGDRTRIELTREEFEARTQDLVERTIDFVHQALDSVGLTPDGIDLVLLVGGSTKMPMIKSAVEALFPGKVRVEDPDLAVAKGAALAAAIEWNERIQEIVSGEKTVEDSEIADSLIADQSDEKASLPKEDLTGLMINIPQHVATGAVSDKLTRSLGPAVYVDEDSYMIDNLLFVGDEIPAEATAVYGTRMDNQEYIRLNVFENVATDRENKHVTPSVDADGEKQYTDPALKVKKIGDLVLQLPPNTVQGTPIQVVFRASGIGLEVSATNLETNESATVTIESDDGGILLPDELDERKKRFADIKTSGQI